MPVVHVYFLFSRAVGLKDEGWDSADKLDAGLQQMRNQSHHGNSNRSRTPGSEENKDVLGGCGAGRSSSSSDSVSTPNGSSVLEVPTDIAPMADAADRLDEVRQAQWPLAPASVMPFRVQGAGLRGPPLQLTACTSLPGFTWRLSCTYLPGREQLVGCTAGFDAGFTRTDELVTSCGLQCGLV